MVSELEKDIIMDGVEAGVLKVQEVQPRWRSWALWVSVAGAVWTIMSALGLPEKWGIDSTTAKTILDAVGVILIAFGICNNPTDPSHF